MKKSATAFSPCPLVQSKRRSQSPKGIATCAYDIQTQFTCGIVWDFRCCSWVLFLLSQCAWAYCDSGWGLALIAHNNNNTCQIGIVQDEVWRFLLHRFNYVAWRCVDNFWYISHINFAVKY